MTPAERETCDAVLDVAAKALQLLRSVLKSMKAGTPIDTARIEAKAAEMSELFWQAQDRFNGLRPDGTEAPAATVH